ncbi:MAG: hypothetical protein HY343_06960 [Lentisphaerae bacterium]|nr:hypothetical protein [Lentisphaerota bacterium]
MKQAITVRAFVWGVVFAALFAVLTVCNTNLASLHPVVTQLPVLPYLLLMLMLLLLNPLCRLVRFIRTFSTSELLVIFLMGMVSSGVSTVGMVDQLIPVVGSLFNRAFNQEWKTPKSEWNLYIVPFVNNEYFVSGPGIQAAAREYQQATVECSLRRTAYDTAWRLLDTRTNQAAAATNLRRVESAANISVEELSLAREVFTNAIQASTEAEQKRREFTEKTPGLPSPENLAETYPALIRESEARVVETESRLHALEKETFDRIVLFRRGLSRGHNAYPGVFPMPHDNIRSYVSRFQRLSQGLTALSELKAAQAIVDAQPGESPLGGGALAEVQHRLAAATDTLRPSAQTNMFHEYREMLRREAAEQAEEFQLMEYRNSELREKIRNEKMRNATPSDAYNLARQISELDSERKDLIKKRLQLHQRLEVKARRNANELVAAAAVKVIVENLEQLHAELQIAPPTAAECATKLVAARAQLATMDVSLRRYFIGDVPWSHWLGPLARWAVIIGLTYIVLMALNLLLIRQWAHNEKLTYPLAELPKVLLGGPDSDSGISPIFKASWFWIGFSVAAMVMGWNLLCASKVVPGFVPLELNARHTWLQYVANTPFEALRSMRCEICLTVIGLSFLIPKKVSFSLWFFYVLFMVQLLLMVWTGQGQDERSFPNDWWCLLNFRTAEGQGALLVFSSVLLYKCRKYILCAFRPSTVNDLEVNEQRELRWASFAFLLGSLGLVLLLWKGLGANLFYTVFVYFVIMLITIGLVRAVTEGGLLSFQAWCGPFHFIRAFFGLDKTWSSATLFAPLMIYYAIFFLDLKAFIAPAMANAIKLRDDFRLRRGAFHAAIFAAIAVACVTAVITVLLMAYARGADSLNSWHYTDFPRSYMFETIRTMVKNAPSASPTTAGWVGVGAAAMAGLLYFRQFVSWLPHPLGMIMLVNPIMNAYWFSILLGWLCNVAVTRSGNKETYHKATYFFIGLIVGELLVAALAMLIGLILGHNLASF